MASYADDVRKIGYSAVLRHKGGYRLYGEIISSEGMARFFMSEAVLVNGAE
jgi:hypothetical protein